SDIPQIEALISKDGSRKDLDDNLKLAIKKVNLRNEINSAKSDIQRGDIIRKALHDSSLADFAWRFHCEAKVDGCASTPPAALERDFAIKPFAENLFPQKVRHYTAIPKPGEAVQKFYETLHGLQMDSPRAQSNLVLMIGNIRRLLGLELSAPADAETLIEYTGIDPDSPIALGSWTAKDALDSTAPAQRRAIVLRVKDRARFERSVEKYQRGAGNFTYLTDILGIGARAVAALPAFLPFTAQAVLETGPTKASTGPLLRYSVVHDKEWNGLRDRMIEHIWINSEWQAESATTHIVYVGDTAIVARDLASIRDLLLNATNGTNGQFLVDNPEFRQALDSKGDVVYFSDVKAVFAEAGDEKKQTNSKINERGALKFSSSTWENSHQLTYEQSDWSKPFLPFNPKELTAPRDLLPASTIAYFLAKIDVPALWSTSSKDLAKEVNDVFSPDVWTDELKQNILPELGPECGFAVLELPELKDYSGGTWAGFCKLKSNKLSEALAAGKLFTNVGPTTDVAELKTGAESYFVAARNGFLVVSNSAKGLAAIDGKTNLASTRDYSRTAEKAPAGIVVLGGYNLTAAITAASRNMTLEEPKATVANLFFSVASAFHSQHFYATVTGGTVAAHSSVSTDREGRYSVADFSYLPRVANITYAVIEPRGVPIRDQNRVSSLVLRVRAKAPGPIDNIKDDIKSASQVVAEKSPTELVVTVAERRGAAEKAVQLPVKNPELAQYLKATPEIASDKKEVIDKAREIAGKDRDAWSVARKLADWTHQNLEWKLVVSANPVQTLATREADCSEFSALFVAMARSLGLPARMVSGLAYSGTAFGGHAWVEVWVGKWVELDPTWGTSFVDATHIRNTTNTLLTSAALNLIELEVLEARRTVAEFQKTPRALTEHLMQAIPAGNKLEIEATIDLPTLADEMMGAGAWGKLNEAERDRMWSAYRRTVNEIISYRREVFGESRLRLLHLEEKGDTAEAICMTSPSDVMIKLRFSRRDGVWHLTEVLQADDGLAIVSEMLRPTITSIEKIRAGEKTSPIVMSDFVRVWMLLDSDSAKANALADELLKSKPKDQGLRLLKAAALMDEDETEAAEKLLIELSNEGLAPAMYRLADYLSYSDDEKEAQRSLELYQRYTTLEPHDPRGFRDLANAYRTAEQPVQTEAALRKALELDPTHTEHYVNLIEFLVLHDRVGEARPLLDTGEKYRDRDEDLLGQIMYDLFHVEDSAPAEKLAASEPARMKKSVMANVGLARIYTEKGRYVDALRLLNGAALIDKKSTLPHIALAMLHRKRSQWLAALRAA
ncbi:MAG TPA: transglutaminase domain-containing protein, partial [Pyrinomonadaceae bacterium]|nr:transglutaminase domain-containing protein [Pyrinomonadaceae bacterium]